MAVGNPDKLRVGVIMGGVSSEKEVSLESGRNIFSKMDRKKYDPIAVFMDSRCALWEIPFKLLMRNSTADVEIDLHEEAKPLAYEALRERCDFVYIGLHGKFGEDGTHPGAPGAYRRALQRLRRSRLGPGHGQVTSRRVLAMSGIEVPKTVPVDRRPGEALDAARS